MTRTRPVADKAALAAGVLQSCGRRNGGALLPSYRPSGARALWLRRCGQGNVLAILSAYTYMNRRFDAKPAGLGWARVCSADAGDGRVSRDVDPERGDPLGGNHHAGG